MDYNPYPVEQHTPEQPAFSDKTIKKAFSRLGWGAFVLMGLTQLLAAVILMTLMSAAPQWMQSPWFNWLLTYLPLYLVAFPIFVLMIRRMPQERPSGTARCSPGTFMKLILLCLGLTYTFNFVSLGINFLISLIKGAPVMNPLAAAATEPLSTFIFGCLVAPIMEEIIFRRLFLNRLLPMGEGFAVYGTAFLFAMFHANLSQLLYAFVLGIVLARLTLQTGSILASTALHMVINPIGMLVLPWLAGVPGWGPIAVGLFIIVIIPVGLLMLKFLPRERLAPSRLPLTSEHKRRAFLLNPGMIAYTVLILVLIVTVIMV